MAVGLRSSPVEGLYTPMEAPQTLLKGTRLSAQFKDADFFVLVPAPPVGTRRLSVIKELPPRQQAILVAARLDGMPRREIAERLGISVSTVEKELKLAHEYCLARRDRIME